MDPAPVHRNQTVLAVHTGMGILKVCKNCNSGSHAIIDSQRFCVLCATVQCSSAHRTEKVRPHDVDDPR